MNMFNSIKIIFLIILFGIFLNISHADEKVIFDSDDIANEVLLGSQWKCNDSSLGNQGISGQTVIEFESVTKRKVSAKIWKKECSETQAKLVGSIKNDVLKYKLKGLSKNCWKNVKGKLEFYKEESGRFVSDGFYKGRFISKLSEQHRTSENIDGRLVCNKQ